MIGIWYTIQYTLILNIYWKVHNNNMLYNMLYKMKYIVLHNTYKIYIFLNEVILQYNVIGFISVSAAQYRIEIIFLYTYYVPLPLYYGQGTTI